MHTWRGRNMLRDGVRECGGAGGQELWKNLSCPLATAHWLATGYVHFHFLVRILRFNNFASAAADGRTRNCVGCDQQLQPPCFVQLSITASLQLQPQQQSASVCFSAQVCVLLLINLPTTSVRYRQVSHRHAGCLRIMISVIYVLITILTIHWELSQFRRRKIIHLPQI